MAVMNREVNEEWIRRLAELSCIALREDEVASLTAGIAEILKALERMEDTSDRGDRMKDAVELAELREDAPASSLEREQLLAAAECRLEDCFLVPRVMDGDEVTA
ncbi:MAG: aspartyl/glutamyl-tRNA amidotransferase subunit C [Ruminococcaceae bacterium]|nr:aspartyl/glutamyl-tRNA amidotransferase subunit C [Oscillospiraceae bacterium]